MDGETPGPVGEINPEEVSSTSFPKPEEQPQVVKITPEEIEESKRRDKERVDEILRSLKGEKDTELPKVLSSKEVVKSEADTKEYEFYEFNLQSGSPIKVVFKGREETIDPESVSSEHVVRIGKEPQYLPEKEFNDWQKSFDGKGNARLEHLVQQHRLDEYSQKGGLTMVVDQTPESIMGAALLLGATDPKVREFYNQARNFQYSDELLEQIDKAIAGHDLNRDGKDNLLGSSHDPEALLLASLLGDKEAEVELGRMKAFYDKNYQGDMDTVQREHREFFDEPGKAEHRAHQRETLGPLKVEDLVAVHVTRYYPTYDKESGSWKMKTHFDATEGKVPRTSLHFALNHIVQSHMSGSWDETPIVIVTPLADLMRENGVPDVLNTIDTYWDLNPGQDLTLPENSWILVPGRTEGGKLAKGSSRNSMRHKGPDGSIHKVNYPVYDSAKLQDLRRRIDTDILWGGEEGPERDEQRELNRQQTEEVERLSENRNQSVSKLIKSLGFEPKPGGEWAWGGSWDVTAQTGLLADDLGTTISSHDVQPAARIEKSALRYLTSIKEGQENNQQMRGPLRYNWPKLEEQQRRTLWAMGLV